MWESVRLYWKHWRATKRRKSPKRGAVAEVFAELVSFPRLPAEPTFSLKVLLTQGEIEPC
jgi:hypothetical protein